MLDHALGRLVPRFLREDEAAAYLGVSVAAFQREVAAGMWPPAVRRGAAPGKRGAVLTWDRHLLDRAADALSRIGEGLPRKTDTDSIMVAAALAAADRE
jgi:hypothetical protein